MRKGFTLVELIVVVIVIGILATMAIPQYLKATERAKGAKARNALALISGGMKQYRIVNTTFPDSYNGATLAILNTDYVELGRIAQAGNTDGDWTYTIVPGGSNTFTVRATRTAGNCNGGTIVYDQNGPATGSGLCSGNFGAWNP